MSRRNAIVWLVRREGRDERGGYDALACGGMLGQAGLG